jgi:predicted RNA-binding protein with PIN domain
MHYWIDGYNLLFRLTKTYKAMRQNERKILLALNEAILRLGYLVTVILDGREKDPPEALRRNLSSLSLIYTPIHQTADDYILEMIADAAHPAEQTVISSDFELLTKAKQRGARGMTVEQFLIKLTKKRKKAVVEGKEFKETQAHLQRLLKIFEEKLEEES